MPVRTPTLVQQKLIFWASLVLLITVSVVSFGSTKRLIALSERAEQSQIILTDLNRYLSNLQDVESGTRGFVITGDRRYLKPYHAGKSEAGQTLARLRSLSSEDETLAPRVDALETLGKRRIAVADRIVDERARLPAPAEPVSAMDQGRAAMDRLRAEVDAAVAVEQADHIRRKRAVERQAVVTNTALAAGVGLSLAALAWLFTVRNREAARRRRAETELKTLNAALEDRVTHRTAELERSRALLDAVIENMPDTVFLKDIRDHFRYVLINGAGERLLGRHRAELLGHEDHELFPRELADRCHQEDEAVVATGREQPVSEQSMAVGGETKVIEGRKLPISDSDGSQHYVLGIVRDITEQKALENQLRQVQRMDALGRLTGGIAHDFNNILAIIVGNADLLREQVSDGSEAAEMTDEVLGAASHGAELVKRLLAFARKQHLDPVVLDLNERLPAITGLLQRTLGETIRIAVQPAADLWPALIDPTQVDDALVNLAINARDAMPDGGSLTIETANVQLDEDYAAHHVEVTPGEYVMLAVSDSGTGMSPEVIARAFEPFFTTKPEGKGTGLGLSQVYGWVKQSGGHIKVYSEVGHGTTIKLYLPRADAISDPLPAESRAGGSAPRGSETIFVVEDNPNVRSTVLRQLKDLGYSTIDAHDGANAVAMARAGAEFDLLLTDVIMPGGMTGYDVAEQLGALRPDLKVLFTSGYTELAAGHGTAARAAPLLSKPYRKQDLGRAVRAVLDA
ncbi:MAG TPA: CHASE3 domain-containing protein [Allosphingosinicella sp.]|nr:CHASE3 domain-containing protein [Allosphingosinicella sp.]